MSPADHRQFVTLDISLPIWERFFTVAPLVLVGTREPDGSYDLAPKHLAIPMGWHNYFGFVCTPRHGTYANAAREGAFSVSYPRPSQLLETSLAAAPREADHSKPALQALATVPASRIDCVLVADSYVHLECELDRIIDEFGDNSLITGRIIAARVHEDALLASERDEQDLLAAAPLLAYLYPSRFAEIGQTRSFPFPVDMKR